MSNDELDLDTPGGRDFFLHGVSQPLISVERMREKSYEKSNQKWNLFHGVKVDLLWEDKRNFCLIIQPKRISNKLLGTKKSTGEAMQQDEMVGIEEEKKEKSLHSKTKQSTEESKIYGKVVLFVFNFKTHLR